MESNKITKCHFLCPKKKVVKWNIKCTYNFKSLKYKTVVIPYYAKVAKSTRYLLQLSLLS